MTKLASSLSGGEQAISEMTYDSYGNIKTFTGPANAGGQRYGLTYVYDNTVHTYAESITDSF
ncbi:MAG: hypothetical protein RQ824_12800, partial [bacterium]|nr:hypothetical protein [bacterium]